MAKDTCVKENCALWDLFGDGKKCPNYYKNIFYEGGTVEGAREIHDCAPIRNMLLTQELHSLFIGTQKAFEQQRNEMNKTLAPVTEFMVFLKEMSKRAKELESKGKENVEQISTEEKNKD